MIVAAAMWVRQSTLSFLHSIAAPDTTVLCNTEEREGIGPSWKTRSDRGTITTVLRVNLTQAEWKVHLSFGKYLEFYLERAVSLAAAQTVDVGSSTVKVPRRTQINCEMCPLNRPGIH